MGSSFGTLLKPEDEDIAAQKKRNKLIKDIRRIYWDPDGNLRYGNTTRNRDDEVMHIIQADTNDEKDETKLWMIVPSRWINQWLVFAYYKMGPEPGKIPMFTLLKQDASVEGGWRPKNNLLPPESGRVNAGVPGGGMTEDRPGHYRRISLEAWLKLLDLYGIEGYAIAVRGIPYDDLSRWRVFLNPRIIDINMLPEPELPQVKEEGKTDDSKTQKPKK